MEGTRYFANDAPVEVSTLGRILLDTIDQYGDAAAFQKWVDDQPVDTTYNDVLETCRIGAGAFQAMGIQRGDRAAIVSENRLEWALADYACVASGVVDVPIYPTLTPAQIAYILEDSGAALVFVSDAELLAKVLEARYSMATDPRVVTFDGESDRASGVLSWADFLADGAASAPSTEALRESILRIASDDMLTLIYTSGTTGNPKGVMLTHGNLSSNVLASRQILPASSDDITLSFLPLSHVFQRMVDYLFFSGGCTIVHGTIDGVSDDLKRVRPTKVVSVPRLYEKVYQRVLDAGGLKGRLVQWAANTGREAARYREAGKKVPGLLSLKYALADRLVFKKIRAGVGGRLDYFVSGGAALSPEINRFFYAAGITILEGYGLTETSPVTNVNTLEHFRIGTVGRPVPSTEVQIADDGEIMIRGPQVMKGYYGLPEMTAAVMTDDGWFKTGDIGELSSDGFLTITDRKKDLIKTSGGKYVAPQPIENRLKKNAFVDQASVVGEGRKFCAVLVVPAFERLAEWGKEQGLGGDVATLLNDERCQRYLADQIFGELRDLARFETPKKIGLLPDPFTIEDGSLTPTQKVKRAVVNERYAALIDSFYASDAVDQVVFVADGSGE